MTTLHLGKSIGRSLSWRCGFLLIPLALACFALPPAARAFLPPPDPDGGYLNLNTAEGTNALYSLTTGADNTAIGFGPLFRNTTGGDNTANGAFALAANTTGNNNTATGAFALSNNRTDNNITANNNTATGFSALGGNNHGSQNTATGAYALITNDASNNTADGFQALLKNDVGKENTAVGESAFKNSTVDSNTGVGFQVAFHNTTGTRNTAVGHHALSNNRTGSSNIALGLNAGGNLTTGSNNIDIGSQGVAGEANTIRIGGPQTRTFIKGISGTVVSGAAVVVNAGGQLGMAASSARFKDEIKPMNKASKVILALKPVTFRYKKEIDPERLPQFGLVAEEVEKVNPNLVVRDKEGKPYSVRYEQVNAMLLNEFLKEHRRVERQECKIQEQETTIAQLKREMETVVTHAKEQDANIQRVSAQVEISKPAPRMAINP